jgi:Phage integrase family
VLGVAGLRISEALGLEWRDVNLARGELVVRRSKTEAGERVVVLPPALVEELVEELVEWKARSRFPAPTDLVFGTSQGKRDGRSNVTRRLLRPVIEAANAELVKAGITPIEALTLHGLRRGAAILSEATGATASETAGQLGHKNPTITTGIYMVAMKHRARLSQAERAAFAEAIAWASMGTSAQSTGLELVTAPEGAGRKPHSERASGEWAVPGSNQRPPACKAGALPTELTAQCPQRDSNPRYGLERAVTWTASRWGPGGGKDSCRPRLHSLRGPVAQLVEQGTFNPKVAGSNPARPIPSRMAKRNTHGCAGQVCRVCRKCAPRACLGACLGRARFRRLG